MAEDKQISEQEAQEMLRQFNESTSGVHSFLRSVVQSDNTAKTGNLNDDELGIPTIPLRTMKELAMFSNDVADENLWADYFRKLAEIQTSTSLSKEGLLVRLAVTQKKELSETSNSQNQEPMKRNKGWFKKGEGKNPQSQ